MEWNNMYAPLEPPKGYERFYTDKAVFPGYQSKLEFKSWKEFKDNLVGGWRLYLHHFIPDPRFEGWEEKMEETQRKKDEARADRYASQVTKAVERGRDHSEKIREAIDDAKPHAKDYMQNRLTILQQAVSEFAQGFQESVSGEKNIWGVKMSDLNDSSQDNEPPIVYIAEEHVASKED